MGLLEILTAVFVILKVTETVDWSWWLVFSPLYVYVLLIALWLLYAMFVGAVGIATAATMKRDRLKKRK